MGVPPQPGTRRGSSTGWQRPSGSGVGRGCGRSRQRSDESSWAPPATVRAADACLRSSHFLLSKWAMAPSCRALSDVNVLLSAFTTTLDAQVVVVREFEEYAQHDRMDVRLLVECRLAR